MVLDKQMSKVQLTSRTQPTRRPIPSHEFVRWYGWWEPSVNQPWFVGNSMKISRFIEIIIVRWCSQKKSWVLKDFPWFFQDVHMEMETSMFHGIWSIFHDFRISIPMNTSWNVRDFSSSHAFDGLVRGCYRYFLCLCTAVNCPFADREASWFWKTNDDEITSINNLVWR